MKLSNENLIAFNSYGGFNEKGDEYHILNPNTPLPWCNVIANKNFGSIISSKGIVYTYFKNSREFKITDWCNDWVTFVPGERFVGIFEKDYNLNYGFGYVKVTEEDAKIEKTMDIFVPSEDNLKFHYITIKNNSNEVYNTDIEYILNPVLGVSSEISSNHVICKQINDKLCLKNPYSLEFSKNIIYVGAIGDVNIEFDSENYKVKTNLTVEANSSKTFAIYLGASEDKNFDILSKYKNIDDVETEYNSTKSYWRNLVVKDFNTGDKYIDIMANGWLLYQTIACRLFAKSGFYQAGGAIGYRDQLQDTMALLNTWPERTRDQIILHSSKQFEKGDVLHWWHEHNKAGIRTYFSDDYLWLPYTLSEYLLKTNDYSILEVRTCYLEDKAMGDKREFYEVFNNIEKSDTVYAHAKKAITYGLGRVNETNGLLDIGDGDWNDGFSNIRGQSVWLTFFMMDILDRFSKISEKVNDEEMIKLCETSRHRFKHSILANTWDEGHFVRAFFENGEVLGSNSNKECKIDLISQAWAAIALKDYPDTRPEIITALDSADKYLVDRENMIVRLLYPSFDKPKNDPGYIKAYVPGTRENGGQYTHASTWLAKAYFEIDEFEKGFEILKIINPIYHGDSKEKANVYMVEPYVVAADVYTNPDHIGRGGWTWYTGSSAWMYKIIEDYLSNKKISTDDSIID